MPRISFSARLVITATGGYGNLTAFGHRSRPDDCDIINNMLKGLYTRVVGDPNDKLIARLRPIVEKINRMADTFQALSDEQLRAKTTEFRKRLAGGESLD